MEEELYDDWSAFNELLSSIELSLPEVDFTQSGVDISISQIVCRDLTVTGMTLDTTFLNATTQHLSLEVDGVVRLLHLPMGLRCHARLIWRWDRKCTN